MSLYGRVVHLLEEGHRVRVFLLLHASANKLQEIPQRDFTFGTDQADLLELSTLEKEEPKLLD